MTSAARVTANSTAAFSSASLPPAFIAARCARPHAEAGKLHLLSEAAAAELAGFRPCLKCRPELAPGLALIDLGKPLRRWRCSSSSRAICPNTAPALAARLGISDRHLRRIFAEQFGARRSITRSRTGCCRPNVWLADTDLPLSGVAFAAGFGSLRRFNELFKARYRLIPSALRSGGARGERAPPAARVPPRAIGRPRLDRMLNFLQARAVQGVRAAAICVRPVSRGGNILRLAQRSRKKRATGSG